jgi:hypothetical protein
MEDLLHNELIPATNPIVSTELYDRLDELAESYAYDLRNSIELDWEEFKTILLCAFVTKHEKFMFLIIRPYLNFPPKCREVIYFYALVCNIPSFYFEYILNWKHTEIKNYNGKTVTYTTKTQCGCIVDLFNQVDSSTQDIIRKRMITVAPCYSTLAFLICATRYGFPRDIRTAIAQNIYSSKNDSVLWERGIPEEFRKI